MPQKPRIVVLTGAGISAESGLKTFRDSDGLWENHDVTEVASPEGWAANAELVQRFYNDRRAQLAEVAPNAAHHFLAELESQYDVQIITQNIDDLHERAGSTQVLHLHGELTKAESVGNPKYVKDIGYNRIEMGEKCPDGHQIRPHVVWFGEPVIAMDEAIRRTATADIFWVIGTSLQVYPAAGLSNYAPKGTPMVLVDPNAHPYQQYADYTLFINKAVRAVPDLRVWLDKHFNEQPS